MLDKKTIGIVVLSCCVAGGIVAIVISYKNGKKEGADGEDLAKRKQEVIERIQSARNEREQEDVPDIPKAPVEPAIPDVIEMPPPEFKVIKRDKVDLDELVKTIESEEDKPVDTVKFDETGWPIFSEEEYRSEEGNIEIVDKEDYDDLDLDPSYDRGTAVWFPDDGILADEDLARIDVVDNVGPTAFELLCKHPELTFHVRNEELQKYFELSVNKYASYEEALSEGETVLIEDADDDCGEELYHMED